jgi:16S rRNA (uracil1498-N3)-methyltransferase
MTHFYVLPQDIDGDRVLFRGDEAKHLRVVYRKSVGDVVSAVDGLGNELTVLLEHVKPKSVAGRVIRFRRKSRETVSRVTLAQAVGKGGKMDLVVQKGTELGVYRFVPMITQHTVVSPDEHSSLKKQRRWQRVAISAMKQSLRSHLPVVDPLTNFDQVLREAEKADLTLMASMVKEAESLDRVFEERQALRDVMLLVGPEGGFSSQEILQALQRGIGLVSLGPRRLRTETAGILLVGLVLFQLGELE